MDGPYVTVTYVVASTTTKRKSADIHVKIVTSRVHTDPLNVEEEEEKTTGTTIRRKGSGDQEVMRNPNTKEHQKDRGLPGRH